MNWIQLILKQGLPVIQSRQLLIYFHKSYNIWWTWLFLITQRRKCCISFWHLVSTKKYIYSTIFWKKYMQAIMTVFICANLTCVGQNKQQIFVRITHDSNVFCRIKTQWGIFVDNLINIISAKFGSSWPRSFRGEDQNMKWLTTMNWGTDEQTNDSCLSDGQSSHDSC